MAGDSEAARKLRFYWSDFDGDWFIFLAGIDGKRCSGVENIEVLVLEAQLRLGVFRAVGAIMKEIKQRRGIAVAKRQISGRYIGGLGVRRKGGAGCYRQFFCCGVEFHTDRELSLTVSQIIDT